MSTDVVRRRALGAVRFVDGVTETPLSAPLVPSASGVRFARNLSGLYVVRAAPGLEAYAAALDEPGFDPGSVQPVEMAVHDPAGRYLARRFALPLPRDPDAANDEAAGSVFRVVDVPVYPSPAARAGARWAVVRAAVPGAEADTPAPGALLRALRVSDGKVLARGMADHRGEALLAIPGIPVTTWAEGGSGGVLTTTVEVDVEAVWDPAAIAAGLLPDPDHLEAARDTLPRRVVRLTLGSGDREVVRPDGWGAPQ